MDNQILVKNTAEYRVESENDISALRTKLLSQATEAGGDLTAFSYKMCPIKDKGQVVGEYFVVKATITLEQDIKEPIGYWYNIDFVGGRE